MNNAEDELVACVEDDGDASLSPIMLKLWGICLSTQKAFDAEVIFQYSSVCYPTQGDDFICYFVPRNHPRVDEIEAHLMQRLEPVRQDLLRSRREIDGWRPTAYVSIYRYSSLAGAVAYTEAAQRVLEEGVKPEHPDPRRLIDMAGIEGRKAASLALRR
jgi:hypothetical protein